MSPSPYQERSGPISQFGSWPALSPTRPSLEGERHNSSDDSVATLASTSTCDSLTSISTLHSDFGAAELLNEPSRRPDCDMTPLEQRMEGLGLHKRESPAVPSLTRPSPSPTPSARSMLSNIVTSGSAYAGLVAPSQVSRPASALCASPALSPTVAVFPPAVTSTTPPSDSQHSSSGPYASPSVSPRSASLSSSASPVHLLLGGDPSARPVGPPASPRAGSLPPSSTTRPSSADTFSTISSSGRPWVFDSDASSICSATSSMTGGSGSVKDGGASACGGRVCLNDEGKEELVEEGGEVYKPQGDYFLDDRPEPPDTSLDIDRSDPSQVIVRVRLPGFFLENITVAMRRGHKVHIVADSYGESGGHYEKLVTLGSDVSSAAPRAEFDGTLLRIFIHRRPSRPSSAVSVPGQIAPAPFGQGHPYGPGLSLPGSPLGSTVSSSPDLGSSSLDHNRRPSIASSLASAWSLESLASGSSSMSLSPSLEAYAFGPPLMPLPLPGGAGVDTSDETLPPPCTARAGPAPDYHKRAKCLTGPEGARAAAKAAREEAARRAKEEVKNLPKEARGGRKLPFRRQKGESATTADVAAPGGTTGAARASSGGDSSNSSSGRSTEPSCSSSGAASGSSSPVTSDSSPPCGWSRASPEEPLVPLVQRGGTIKGPSRTVSPLPAVARHSRPPLSHQSSGSTVTGSDAATSHALESASTQLSEHLQRHPDAAAATAPPPSGAARPKMRGHNLTLRPFDRSQSFMDAAAATAMGTGPEGASSPSASSDGGGATPRKEDRGMRFTPFST